MKNFLFLCGIVLVTIVHVSCYEFDNSHFNQILLDTILQLELNNADVENHSRVRRATNTFNINLAPHDQCCEFKIAPPCKKATDAAIQCYNENATQYSSDIVNHQNAMKKYSVQQGITLYQGLAILNETINNLKRPIACITQCYGQKMNMTDSNNNLVFDELHKQMCSAYNNTWVPNYLNTTMKNCFEEMQHKTKELEKFQKENGCSITLVSFAFCMYKQIQINCPDMYVKNAALCSFFKNMTQDANFITDALYPK